MAITILVKDKRSIAAVKALTAYYNETKRSPRGKRLTERGYLQRLVEQTLESLANQYLPKK